MTARFSIPPLAVWLAMACAVFGQNHFYIRDGATGTNDGTNWTNAFPRIPKALQRGATYYLADGSYGKHTFDAAEAGAFAITIKKATETDRGTAQDWQPAFGDGTADFTEIIINSDWLVLDGSRRTTPSSGHGIKIANPADMIATVTIPGKRSHITLRNIELSGDPALQNRGAGVYAVEGPSNLTIQHCYLHDFFGVPFHLIDANTVTIEHSVIARNKSTAEWHSEGIQARGCKGLIVRYNTWEDMFGTAVIVSGSGQSSGWSIYGNIFNRGDVGHGIVSDNMVDSIEDITVSGNMIIGHRGNAGMNFHKAKGRITVVDNVWFDNTWVSFTGLNTRDYNYFSKCRFPYAFEPAPHESSVRTGADGKYSLRTDSPFSNLQAGDFSLSRDALQLLTRSKD